MLRESITITSSSGTPGNYTCNAIFSDSAKAQHLRVGDTLEDKDAKTYEILAHSSEPSDFVSGGTLTLTQLTGSASAPSTFSSFGDASIFTPGQLDVRSDIKTVGTISGQNLASGADYTYTITCAWGDVSEAQDSVVGDHVMDNSGKVYEITIKDNADFTSGTVREVHLEGVAPAGGEATLFRPTSVLGLFQGTPVSDPARTIVRNRDSAVLDATLDKGLRSVAGDFLNSTGSQLVNLTPVSQTGSGSMEATTLSESSMLNFLGILKDTTEDGFPGTVIFDGLITNITTSFVVSDVLYLNTDGTLTTTIPDIGSGTFVAGNQVVIIGKITKNEFNPANKDLLVKVVWEGTL